jgi:hypothetical protein
MVRSVVVIVASSLLLVAVQPDEAHAQRRGGGLGRTLGGALQNAGNALGVQQVEEQALLPSALGSDWAFLDANNPFASGDSEVKYAVTGLAAYDQFFANVAQMEGRLVLARDTLALANQILDSDLPQQLFSGALMVDIVGENAQLGAAEQRRFVAALMSGNFSRASGLVTGLPEDRFNSIREQFLAENQAVAQIVPRLRPSIGGLTGLVQNASGIVSSVQGMIDSAPNEFVGPQAVLIPRVVEELGQSLVSLGNIVNTGDEIGAQLGELFN